MARKPPPPLPIAEADLNSDKINGFKDSVDEQILRMALQQFPANNDMEIVTAKIKLIDFYYSTQLFRQVKKINAKGIADRIISIDSLDRRIAAGDATVGDELLAKIPEVNLFSFVSKYLTLHNYYCYSRDDFAIYDIRVRTFLPEYAGIFGIRLDEIRNRKGYTEFVKIIQQVIASNNITIDSAHRRLDWFLWLQGEPQNAVNSVSPTPSCVLYGLCNNWIS